jgi:hypothetical protein
MERAWERLQSGAAAMNLNMMNQFGKSRAQTSKLWRITNNNIRAFGGRIQGALVRQRSSNQGVSLAGKEVDEDGLAPLEEVSPAILSNNPRSMLMLWQEYKFGVNGRKAAEQFTVAERNSKPNKQKYYRRNMIWKTIARLVRGGLTPEVAIDRIHRAYGYSTTPTKIMWTMIKDKRRYPGGIHPNLTYDVFFYYFSHVT